MKKIRKNGNLFSFSDWYDTDNNSENILYEAVSYWSFQGGLELLFNNLEIEDVSVGDYFLFDFNSETDLECERNIVDDFRTNCFKVISKTNEFIADDNIIEYYVRYNLTPVYQPNSLL